MGSIDEARLSEWFDAHAAALVLYARQWAGGGMAEDLVQDVFVRLAAERKAPANPRAWLFAAVRNAAISALRSRKRREAREARSAGHGESWFRSAVDDLMDADAAQAALVALPREQREPVILRIWAELTFREIAEIVGEPTSTVFQQYHEGLVAIRQRMERSCKTKHP
ncbi:MAG: RNA polymerase sigma factor [Phycisphaerae bacterium]|nr:RNA polymerase sigma factor [Phycisphaerae bacterium]